MKGYYTLPWYTVAVTGSNSTGISVELTGEGVVLGESNLTNIAVYGENDDETVEFTFSTDADSVLVTGNKEEDGLIIWVDDDGDGTYETPLEDITPPGQTYSLTVTNGAGSGDYEAGTEVSIVADTAPKGKVFDHWYQR